MKTKLFAFIAAVTLAVGLGSSRAAPVSVSIFYESLEPYGEWMDTSDYGYIWHPRDVDDSWRPYTVGNWAYTDAGWTWVSDEPFGWATYHYGRWVEIDRVGWSWVPDQEWGPAWVSWRRSDRHVGWAPLPPEARFEARVGIHEWSDSYYDIGPASYSFVTVRDFGAPRLRTVIIEPRENVTIITETRNITRITYVNNFVVNNGPDYQVIVRDSAQPIRRLKLDRRTDVDFRPGADRTRFRSEISGETLRLPAPQIQVSRDVAPPKVARKLDRVEVDRGWKKVGDPQAAERLRARFASEARPPADLPPLSRAPRIGRAADGERPPTTSDAPARPGATTTAETPTPDRKGKPGARTSAANGDTEKKPSAERPKSGTAADQSQPGSKKESSTARDDREKDRPPSAVQTPADEPGRPAPGAESKKPAADATEKSPSRPKTSAEKPERPAPVAAGEKNSRRPEAPATEPPAAPVRPDAGKPKKKENPQSEKSARVAPEREPADRPSKDKPPGDRPGAGKPDRPENPAKPEATDRPDRKGPSSGERSSQRPPKEEASPDRVKPEGVDRSRESRPPSPNADAGEAPKKGAKPPEKRGEKEDKKEKEKN